MVGWQHIVVTVRYEPHVGYATSLTWIAPELRNAGLTLIDDHLEDPVPSRTWAGRIDGRTFGRFAKSWGLPQLSQRARSKLEDGENMASYARTYDGMNWEVAGESPIISVSVLVNPDSLPPRSEPTRTGGPRRGSRRAPTARPCATRPAVIRTGSRRDAR